MIPWLVLAENYAPLFNPRKGGHAKPFRMAFGLNYIQPRRLGFSVRETVELITESAYLQFFLGLSGFQHLPPFDPSMMVHFRKRIGPNLIKNYNDMTRANSIEAFTELLAFCTEPETGVDNNKYQSIEEGPSFMPPCGNPTGNWGIIICDAPCIPDDIPYPVDF